MTLALVNGIYIIADATIPRRSFVFGQSRS